jgi:hypothetical protein
MRFHFYFFYLPEFPAGSAFFSIVPPHHSKSILETAVVVACIDDQPHQYERHRSTPKNCVREKSDDATLRWKIFQTTRCGPRVPPEKNERSRLQTSRSTAPTTKTWAKSNRAVPDFRRATSIRAFTIHRLRTSAPRGYILRNLACRLINFRRRFLRNQHFLPIFETSSDGRNSVVIRSVPDCGAARFVFNETGRSLTKEQAHDDTMARTGDPFLATAAATEVFARQAMYESGRDGAIPNSGTVGGNLFDLGATAASLYFNSSNNNKQ